jgi:hypothetical protein
MNWFVRDDGRSEPRLLNDPGYRIRVSEAWQDFYGGIMADALEAWIAKGWAFDWRIDEHLRNC